MTDVACILLGIFPKREWHYGQLIEVGTQWLFAFNDPLRGLTPTDPCYIDQDAIEAYYPYDPDTGEFHFSDTDYGPGVLRIPAMLWDDMPNLIVRDVQERERIAKAEANALRRAAEKNPKNHRRREDAWGRAHKKKRAETADALQTEMFLKRD